MAPAFSIASESSMDRAIVTPSLITLRFPDSERITFRPAWLGMKQISKKKQQTLDQNQPMTI